MRAGDPVTFLCNDAQLHEEGSAAASRIQTLNYESRCNRQANVRIGLPDFVSGVYHLPDRVLDLLELAAYVYCADRMTSRGQVRAWNIMLGRGRWILSSEFGTMNSGDRKKSPTALPALSNS